MEENKKEHPIIVKYNNLIKDAMKAHEKAKLNTYKLVKARMLEYKTGAADQDGNYPVLDEKAEIQILNKMVKELQGDIKTRLSVGRTEEASEFTDSCNFSYVFAALFSTRVECPHITSTTINIISKIMHNIL